MVTSSRAFTADVDLTVMVQRRRGCRDCGVDTMFGWSSKLPSMASSSPSPHFRLRIHQTHLIVRSFTVFLLQVKCCSPANHFAFMMPPFLLLSLPLLLLDSSLSACTDALNHDAGKMVLRIFNNGEGKGKARKSPSIDNSFCNQSVGGIPYQQQQQQWPLLQSLAPSHTQHLIYIHSTLRPIPDQK